jgi:hypothetical protein
MSGWTLVGKTALVVVHMQNAICKSPRPLDFIMPRVETLLVPGAGHDVVVAETFPSA